MLEHSIGADGHMQWKYMEIFRVSVCFIGMFFPFVKKNKVTNIDYKNTMVSDT